MIARDWPWATASNAALYERHYRESVLPHLREIPGCVGAHLLRRAAGHDSEVELIAVSYYESLEAIRAFAGDDLERAVVEPAARAVLSRFDERCRHYEIVASLDQPSGC